jgi:hypothetical protein
MMGGVPKKKGATSHLQLPHHLYRIILILEVVRREEFQVGFPAKQYW